MRIKRKEAMKILKSCFPCDMIFNDQFVKKYMTLRELKKDDDMLVSFIFDDLFIPVNDPNNEKLLKFEQKGSLDLWYMRSGLKLMRVKNV